MTTRPDAPLPVEPDALSWSPLRSSLAPLRFVLACMGLTSLLAACAPHPSAPAAPTARPPVAIDPESGEGRAEAAGQSLLGKPGPRVDIHTLDGATLRLADLYGRKPVYLKFWATWCVPCREQMPGFERDYERLGDRIAFVGVNAGFDDDEAGVRAYRDRLGLHMPITIDDGTLAAALNLRVTPQHVVIGRDGRILYVGHLADERLERALEAAVATPGSDRVEGGAVARARVYGIGDAPRELPPGITSAGEAFPIGGPYPDGLPRVLVFFSPWCESYLAKSRPEVATACRRVREQTNQLVKTEHARWLGIASGLWASAADVAQYTKEQEATIPVALDTDGALFRAFGVRSMPTVVVLDAAGRIVRRLEPADEDLAGAIRAAEAAVHTSQATEPGQPVRERAVQTQALPPLNGSTLKVHAFEVTYPPGGASSPHTHPCPVLGYVLDGALRMQVEGEPEAVYRAGETFYESPHAEHLISANASTTQSARFLAYFVCDREVELSAAISRQGAPTKSRERSQ